MTRYQIKPGEALAISNGSSASSCASAHRPSRLRQPSIRTRAIAVLARAALKGERASAVQSATGFFYLSVVTAFTAEIAVKTRFFPT